MLEQAEDVESFYLQQVLPHKIQLNLAYALSSSIWEDTKIILRTLFPRIPLRSKAETPPSCQPPSKNPLPPSDKTSPLS